MKIGDRVLWGDRSGRIVRLRKLRGLAMVVLSKNFTVWVDVEELNPAVTKQTVSGNEQK